MNISTKSNAHYQKSRICVIIFHDGNTDSCYWGRSDSNVSMPTLNEEDTYFKKCMFICICAACV